MKKKLTAIIAAIMTASIMVPFVSAMDFTDISGLNETQLTVLEDSVNRGIITGDEDNTVRPYGTLTRAEFAAMICRYKRYGIGANSSFSDVLSHWASGYIQACVDKGAINGIGNNLFVPEAPVTFNQAAKIVTIVSGMVNGANIDGLGGYPTAYLTVGQDNGLFENLTDGITGEDYSLSRIDAITMLSNAGNLDDAASTTLSTSKERLKAAIQKSDEKFDLTPERSEQRYSQVEGIIGSYIQSDMGITNKEVTEFLTSVFEEVLAEYLSLNTAKDLHTLVINKLSEGFNNADPEIAKLRSEIYYWSMACEDCVYRIENF